MHHHRNAPSHYIDRLMSMVWPTKPMKYTQKTIKYSKKATHQDFYCNPDTSFVRFCFINVKFDKSAQQRTAGMSLLSPQNFLQNLLLQIHDQKNFLGHLWWMIFSLFLLSCICILLEMSLCNNFTWSENRINHY